MAIVCYTFDSKIKLVVTEKIKYLINFKEINVNYQYYFVNKAILGPLKLLTRSFNHLAD